MFEITPAASARIRDFMAARQPSPIRIHVAPALTGGPSLAMAFDSASASDAVHEMDGITFLVDRTLLEQIGPIRIDCDGLALRFSSRLKPDGGGCGCGCGGH